MTTFAGRTRGLLPNYLRALVFGGAVLMAAAPAEAQNGPGDGYRPRGERRIERPYDGRRNDEGRRYREGRRFYDGGRYYEGGRFYGGGCRIVITRRINRFGERVIVRRRICG
jgi:hypothetical protein